MLLLKPHCQKMSATPPQQYLSLQLPLQRFITLKRSAFYFLFDENPSVKSTQHTNWY